MPTINTGLNEMSYLLARLLNKTVIFRKFIFVGTIVDVVYCSGCMDTEDYRVKGKITHRCVNYGFERDGEKYYKYVIETENKILHMHSSWAYFNPETKIWEFKKK
jgi:hypothetical protein